MSYPVRLQLSKVIYYAEGLCRKIFNWVKAAGSVANFLLLLRYCRFSAHNWVR